MPIETILKNIGGTIRTVTEFVEDEVIDRISNQIEYGVDEFRQGNPAPVLNAMSLGMSGAMAPLTQAVRGVDETEGTLLESAGNYVEDNRIFSKKLNDINIKRNNLKNLKKEQFKNTKDFNSTFDKKKENGDYSRQIIKVENEEIVPYDTSKSNISYVELKNFNKLYLEDSVQTSNYTSLNRAFLLQPVMKNTKEDINKELSKYKNQTENLKNIDIDI